VAKVRVIEVDGFVQVEIDGRKLPDVTGVKIAMRPGVTTVELSIYVEELVLDAQCNQLLVLPDAP